MQVSIAGGYALPPSGEIPMALEEMIYAVTSRALGVSGIGINDVTGSFMAASDLYDGRAISTMTLTGSTGSFHKSEMRVCNDSLAALMLASAEVAAGAADAVIVCTWSKLSDASRAAILPLALEPVYTRGLGLHPGAILALRESSERGQPTVLGPSRIEPADVAVAMILTAPTPARPPRGTVVGLGAANGSYLAPGMAVLAPMSAAAAAALTAAQRGAADVRRVRVGGLHDIEDTEIAAAIGVPPDRVIRGEGRWADLGYAAGLLAVHEALEDDNRGLTLVVTAGGLGLENSYAALVDIA